MSAASMALPVRPDRGLTFRTELWTCSPSGEMNQDITSAMDELAVSVNWLGDVKTTAVTNLTEPVTIRPLIDYLMPRMILEWRDSFGVVQRVEEPLGVVIPHFPDQERTEFVTTDFVESNDGLWLLSQLTNNVMRWIDTNRDFGSAARGLLEGLSPLNLSLPNTGRFPRSPINVLPGDYLLDAANLLYEKAGRWDLATTRTGTVTTSIKTAQARSFAKRELLTQDVLGDIQVVPDREGFFNQVFLSSNDPEAYPELRDGYQLSFTDPDSPYSVQNMGVVSRPIYDARDETLEDMKTRAALMLQTGAGLMERITVPHWPDPRFDIREDWWLDIRKADGSSDAWGTYRVESMEFGGTPEDCAQVTTLSRVVDIDRFAEG